MRTSLCSKTPPSPKTFIIIMGNHERRENGAHHDLIPNVFVPCVPIISCHDQTRLSSSFTFASRRSSYCSWSPASFPSCHRTNSSLDAYRTLGWPSADNVEKHQSVTTTPFELNSCKSSRKTNSRETRSRGSKQKRNQTCKPDPDPRSHD